MTVWRRVHFQPASHKRESTPPHLLASLCAGVCCAAGERSNLRAGQPTAATAHLYLNMAVPQLLSRYLPAYASFTVCSPALYLLANAPGVVGPDSTLEALANEVAATTARWVHQHSCGVACHLAAMRESSPWLACCAGVQELHPCL